MNKWKSKISKWKFDRKVQALIAVIIIITTFIALSVSTVSSVTYMKKKTKELLQVQNSTLAENYKNTLDEYKALALAMVLDRSVQSYLNYTDKKEDGYSEAANGAYNAMASSLNMYPDMNFIAILNHKLGDYIYKGNMTLISTEFQEVYEKDYKSCKNAQDSTIKMNFSNAYYRGEKYTITVYFPIYDVNKIMEESGFLCINFSNPVLDQILSKEEVGKQETSIIDTDGRIIADQNTKKIGKNVAYTERIQGKQGDFIQDGKLYNYKKVKNWNYYIVSSVEMIELYKPSIRTSVVMAVVLINLVILSLIIVRSIIKKVYKPLEQVVQKMDDVAAGSLGSRLNAENMGEDFEKLATGFNSMMEQILVLMDEVKLEQHQMEQIRFNALQSQIQPHFLYNTLECIHWQAIADGNREISTMVKALAKYYRICLSKGQDIIPLKVEVEHVRNYIIIQNIRYDNIIVSDIKIEEDCENVMIPKLTLQPLVENSIYHGIKIKEGKTGKIFLTARREGENMEIVLTDTGAGMNQERIDEMNQKLSEHDETFGYGVRNVNKRIELLHGKEYGLSYFQNEFGGVTVRIKLPYDTRGVQNER